MKKVRLRFEKSGPLRYISHLDLMRMFGRVMNRLQIPIAYTEGFNPHAYMVFGAPLALGVTGLHEVMDFEMTQDIPYEELLGRFAERTPEGLMIREAYEPVKPLKALSYCDYRVELETSRPAGEVRAVGMELFERPEVLVTKRTKKGVDKEIDLIPMIRELTWQPEGTAFSCVLPCNSAEYCNPELLVGAIAKEAGCDIALARFERGRFYDEKMEEFR